MNIEAILQDLEFYIFEAGIIDHSKNVENNSLLIYDNLEKKPDYPCSLSSREVVGLCGRYHDIGKYFFGKVYPTLLNKDQFNDTDKEIIKQHTLMGQLLLMLSVSRNGRNGEDVFIKALMDSIYYHHERIDGTGYYKRRGDAIPFVAQLIAVADHYSAGIEKRIYCGSKSAKQVLDEIQKDQGLNRECVEALLIGRKKEGMT